MKFKFSNSLYLLFISWFAVAYPVIENLRSNLSILFTSEINQIIIFILFLGIISISLFLINKYIFKFSTEQFIAYTFTIFFLFWNYKNITTKAFNFFNQINLTGFVTFLFLFILFMYLNSKKFIYQYVYRIIRILFVIQLFLFSHTILNLSSNNFQQNNVQPTHQSVDFLGSSPDIYFLLFDAVGSNEYNIKNYNIDFNFITTQHNSFELEIFDNEYSNYASTFYQLSGIMEMEPIQKDNKQLDNAQILSTIKKVSTNNTSVEKFFLEQGYNIYKYGLFFRCAEEDNVYCIGNNVYKVNSVVSEIVDQTPLRLLKEKKIIQLSGSTNNVTKYLFYKTCGLVNQECTGQDIREILNYKTVQEPKLYLLHFMFTHGPFYLDSQCRPYLTEVEMVNFNEAGYNDALNCMFLEVQRLLEKIPSDSVVIIQSDHGPFEIVRDRSNLNQMNEADINSQYSIFSMSNINKFCKDKISSFGGMNTFSQLINCLTNSNTFKIKENYYYYLLEDDLNIFLDISDTINLLKS